MWQMKKLGDVCEVVAGQSPEGKYYNTECVGLPFYQGKKEYGDKYLKPPVKWTSKVSKIALEGDIVMSVRAPVGPVNIVTEEICIGRGLAAIRAKHVDRSFLYLFLLSIQKTLVGSNGAVFNSINRKQIESISISVPPIDTQQKIVAKLDLAFSDIDKAKENAERNLKNVRELFDCYLQSVFSQKGDDWKELTLEQASIDFGRGKSKHRPRNDPALYDGDYPFVQTGDVRGCEHVITAYSKTYNDAGLAQSKLWPKGTICITIAANIAETGILGFDGCFPDSVIGVVVDPEITTVAYTEFLLQSFKAILKAKGKGSAQDNINLGTFEKMTFPFPSLKEQQDIVDVLLELNKSVIELESIYKKKIETLDELKQSILQKAFSGEL
ncbi:type I restriction-modification system [Vibrio ishigakensis]|uniref:Type I restriction-modification system n=1 Tax=Vibrio ishigakensis TaxID=1481914 RepID=A0A0B8PIT5_9VIBR|nr:type I restriction-modification system [Vibrio ishigakensis]